MELQNYINDTENYLRKFKDFNIRVEKRGSLALLKMKKNVDYDFKSNKWLRYCRGAIINTENDKLICVPPMKSDEILISDLNNLDTENIKFQNLLEGTMINIFYYNDKWNISTRSNIGGNNRWDNNLSFLDMFLEVSNDILYYKDLKKEFCYTFVLQHKKNRIVCPVFQNRIVLVSQFNLNDLCYCDLDKFYNIENITNINFKEYLEKENLSFSIKGFTFSNNGIRYKWINPNYTVILSLKMNNNDKFLNYIELRQKRLLKDYLEYFPEDSHQFEIFQRKFYLIKKNLYESYVNHFIKKEIELKEINYSLKPHLFKLHEHYKKTNEKIRINIVADYLHSLDGKQIMFICNYLF